MIYSRREPASVSLPNASSHAHGTAQRHLSVEPPVLLIVLLLDGLGPHLGPARGRALGGDGRASDGDSELLVLADGVGLVKGHRGIGGVVPVRFAVLELE